MSVDPLSEQDSPLQVAYDIGWHDGSYGLEPNGMLGSVDEERAYRDGYRCGAEQNGRPVPDWHCASCDTEHNGPCPVWSPDRDPWWSRLLAAVTSRLGAR